MSAADLAAVLIALVALGAAAVLGVACATLRRSAHRLTVIAEDLERETGRLLDNLDQLATTTRVNVDAVEDLAHRASRVTAELEEASRFGYAAVARPVIKAAGLASGVRVGARRLRGRETVSAQPELAEPAEEVR